MRIVVTDLLLERGAVRSGRKRACWSRPRAWTLGCSNVLWDMRAWLILVATLIVLHGAVLFYTGVFFDAHRGDDATARQLLGDRIRVREHRAADSVPTTAHPLEGASVETVAPVEKVPQQTLVAVRAAKSDVVTAHNDASLLEMGEELQMKQEATIAGGHCWCVATVPRPWYGAVMPELKHIQRTSLTSWVNAGAHEVLYMTESGSAEDYDLSKFEVDPAVAAKVRIVPGLKAENGIPLISSAFHLADNSSSCEYVMWLNTDIFVMQAFGPRLNAVLTALTNVKRFLIVGQRIQLEVPPHEIERIVMEGDDSVYSRLVANSATPRFDRAVGG
jgi:hypothetical protein